MFKRHILLVVCCLALMSGSIVYAKQGSLMPSDKQHLLHDKFVLVKHVRDIPKSVLKNLIGEDLLNGMADPGQPYQVTDVISGPKRLPFQRLIFAAISKKYCLVYSEHGGFAYSTEVSWYRLSGTNAIFGGKVSFHGMKPNKTVSELQKLIVQQSNRVQM